MPYTQDSVVLQRLVDQVIAGPETRRKLESAEVTEQRLGEILTHAAPDIWASASTLIAEFNEKQKHEKSVEGAYGYLLLHKPFYLRLVEDILPATFGFAVFSLFSLLSSWVRRFIVTQWIYFVAALAALAAFMFVTWLVSRQRTARYRFEVAKRRDEYTAATKEAKDLRSQIESALKATVESHVREYLDTMAQPPFRLDLPDTDTSCLAEIQKDGFEVITDGRRYVRGLLEKMGGGSIGIAGPRGCGKTTLLRSFWQEGKADPKQLSIFASAPVKYEAREFLLHLFTSVCSQVIAKEGPEETRNAVVTAWTQMDGLRNLPTPRLFDMGKLASIALIAAIFLFLAGGTIAIAGAVAKKGANTASSNPDAKSEGKSSNATPPTDSDGKSSTGSNSSEKEDEKSSSAFSASAIPYFIWGVIASVVGVSARFSPGQPRPTGIIDFYFSPWVQEQQRREAENKQLEGVDQAALVLLKRAQRTLLGLRFQQSYSSGWSGSLKLPIGLEGSANAAVSFAESQLSLPEVVTEYCGFLRAAAERYDRIVVAIDELDKLASDDEAKTFLNTIKAIFGQPKVYYLVSISENAISNFERRGLPIRDEFDSSFDDAVYLGYLDFAGSRRLLARRLEDPPPYVYRAFCHVVSGGLPRDLIRSCRKLYDYRRQNSKATNAVATICPEVVRQDINAKLGAMRHNLQRVPDEKRTAEVLTLVSTDKWDQTALQDAINQLEALRTKFESEAASTNQGQEAAKADLLSIVNVIEEICVYLRFAYAVGDTFSSINNEARYNELDTAKVFESLAMTRQSLSVNRAAALAMVSKIVPIPSPKPGVVETRKQA